MPTHEILTMPLKPGSDIGNPSNEAAEVVKYVCDELSKTKGCQQIDFGMTVEDPNVFQLIVTWDHLDSHKAFMATEGYLPFRERFGTIAGGKPTMFHVDLEPQGDVLKAFNAPVTEFATFYFGDASTEGYLDNVNKFRAELTKEKVDGVHASAIGHTYEEVEREGVKGKGAVLVVGYDSVASHMAMRDLDVFKQNASVLRAGVQKVEMHHVQLLKYAKTQ